MIGSKGLVGFMVLRARVLYEVYSINERVSVVHLSVLGITLKNLLFGVVCFSSGMFLFIGKGSSERGDNGL